MGKHIGSEGWSKERHAFPLSSDTKPLGVTDNICICSLFAFETVHSAYLPVYICIFVQNLCYLE